MRILDRSTQAYESGYWKLAESTAQALVGGTVYFHEAQAGRSYFGGTITGHRVENGRLVLLFTNELSAQGVDAGSDGWSQEMKIVW
jgi:hypothetical protein